MFANGLALSGRLFSRTYNMTSHIIDERRYGDDGNYLVLLNTLAPSCCTNILFFENIPVIDFDGIAKLLGTRFEYVERAFDDLVSSKNVKLYNGIDYFCINIESIKLHEPYVYRFNNIEYNIPYSDANQNSEFIFRYNYSILLTDFGLWKLLPLINSPFTTMLYDALQTSGNTTVINQYYKKSNKKQVMAYKCK